MKPIRILLVSLFVFVASVSLSPTANAGQLSAAGASISWNDNEFYTPSGCTKYTFNYTATNKVLLASIRITNKFNDEVGSTTFFGPNAGAVSVQVCSSYDLTGTKVALDVRGSSVYGGTDAIVSTPITFLSRNGSSASTPAPAPTVTVTATPAPAPTVTVTATPAPAPTIYLTNPADQNLSALVTSLQSQVKLLNAKLKKICNTKPKPKGC